jgi:uncharacterized membrane protein
MTTPSRNLALTAHVTSSVGWLGAVGVFLALAIVGLTSGDPRLARAAYLAMEVAGWYVIVPLCVASLVTGIVQSLVTKWGLFRHYWVVIKLVLTMFATGLLLLHTGAIRTMAAVAASSTLSPSAHRTLRVQLVFDAGAALAVLVVATILAVYKPRGMTRFGRRKECEGV